jgi:hypothetical protein
MQQKPPYFNYVLKRPGHTKKMTSLSSFETFEKMWKDESKDSFSMQTLLESQYSGLKSGTEILKEINIQTKALTRHGNFLTSLRIRHDSTLAVLKIIDIDGCSPESMAYHLNLRKQLEDRIDFFANVVEQRQKSLVFGQERLEQIGEQKNEKLE